MPYDRGVSDERRKGDRRRDEAPEPIEGDRRQDARRSGMDRRSLDRLPIDIWTEQRKGDETVFRQAGNISAGGVYLEHGFSHPEGTRVSLRFQLPGVEAPIEVDGEVVDAVWEQGRPAATSLRFVDLGGEDRERIIAYLNSVDTEGG